jgi:adenosylcobinamide-phosphate synthase
MSFLSLFFAFLIEQVRPFSYQSWMNQQVTKSGQWIRLHLDAGLDKQAFAAWTLAVVLPCALVAAIYWTLIGWGSWFLGLIWSVAVLYVCIGFRQFSHNFTQIREALESGKEQDAADLFTSWQRLEPRVWKTSTLIRQLIEYSVVAAHRHVFGVLYWYCLLALMGFGPTGAVLFRLTEMLVYVWTEQKDITEGEEVISSEALMSLSQNVWLYMDWIPSRLTAITFAVVGNFEEAIDSWRFHINRFDRSNDAVILAATSGALNIELGVTPLQKETLKDTGEPQGNDPVLGQTPQIAHLKSVVGLLWRGVVMWMLILALFSLSRLMS